MFLFHSFRHAINCQQSIKVFLKRTSSSRNVLKLKERGLLEDIFPVNSANEIVDICNGAPQCVYSGFDPTARSLHIGNLLVLMNLIHWQRGGHMVLAVVGGATGMIGDPSGKNKERELQEVKVVIDNSKLIVEMIRNIFDNHEKYFWKESKTLHPLRLLNNLSWYSDLNCVDFVCTIGRHFRMGTMLSRSSVSSRLKSDAGLSFTEFSYQVFQSYDWLYLLKKYNCRFQVGGNDQMGNIMSGHELISRLSEKSVYGLTLPLITTDSGDKYGKSASNAVWLDSDMTSPFELYQFFMRTPDSNVSALLKYFTFLPLNEINNLCERHMKFPEKREGQRVLAENVTLLVHGTEGLDLAKRATAALYQSDIAQLSTLNHKDISNVFKGATQVKMFLEPGISVKELALSAKCFIDSCDADRIIAAGGFYINNKRAPNPDEILVQGVHILPNNISLLRVGKKNYWIVQWMT